jgi:phosphopantothenoylcysteine decarboxylase/phosphopantothenate--cysteine ligase
MSYCLEKKWIIVGVTGGIAAYKMPNLVSMLSKANAQTQVILTKNAQYIIPPTPFESLSHHKCLTDTFDRNFTMEVEHIAVADKADLLLIAPATANVIGKLANGIADDMLTTTALACTCPKVIAPAMNTKMYENPVVQDNLQKLRDYGWKVIEPANGHLACGTSGVGKMPEPEVLFAAIEETLSAAQKQDLCGKTVLITAGPTREAIDPVRYITNHSTGKMGYALAEAALSRGAKVILISGPVSLTPPAGAQTIPVVSADEMFEAVKQYADQADIIIKAAAVADYTPQVVADNKIKKSDSAMSIALKRTTDILAYLGAHRREGQYLCGFSMETQNLVENSRSKLEKKKVDMIVANNLKVEGAGFGGNTNVITLITKDQCIELPKMSKLEAAHAVLDQIQVCTNN